MSNLILSLRNLDTHCKVLCLAGVLVLIYWVYAFAEIHEINLELRSINRTKNQSVKEMRNFHSLPKMPTESEGISSIPASEPDINGLTNRTLGPKEIDYLYQIPK